LILLCTLALTRRGLRRFEKRVNSYLAEGYEVRELKLEKRGLRTLCYALLSFDPDEGSSRGA
jgi:hypothetical protein